MYYDRTLSDGFANLLEENGKLRWLFEFVKNREELDFLIGKNDSKEWISVYRGLTRIVEIIKTKDAETIKIDGSRTYKKLLPTLYGKRSVDDNFEKELDEIIKIVSKDRRFDRYYNNKKEGYYQNIISRRHGICGHKDDDFVILDKEVVIGFLKGEDITAKQRKEKHLGGFKERYSKLLKELSDSNPKRYGSNNINESVGEELDFLALDKEENIKLIEFKDGRNTKGIYLSPIQIGNYYDIFKSYPKEKLEEAVFKMLEQKQKIGLINPEWEKPYVIKNIIPVLMLSNYKYKGTGREKFDEVLQIARGRDDFGKKFLEHLETCNFTMEKGIHEW